MTREETRPAETSKQVHPVKHFAGAKLQVVAGFQHPPGHEPAHLPLTLFDLFLNKQINQDPLV